MSTYDKSPFREALPTDSLVLSWGAAVGVVPEPAITELFLLPDPNRKSTAYPEDCRYGWCWNQLTMSLGASTTDG
jgi:hypothetical protein